VRTLFTPPPIIVDLNLSLAGRRSTLVVGNQTVESDTEAAKNIEAYLSKIGVNTSMKLDVEVTENDSLTMMVKTDTGLT